MRKLHEMALQLAVPWAAQRVHAVYLLWHKSCITKIQAKWKLMHLNLWNQGHGSCLLTYKVNFPPMPYIFLGFLGWGGELEPCSKLMMWSVCKTVLVFWPNTACLSFIMCSTLPNVCYWLDNFAAWMKDQKLCCLFLLLFFGEGLGCKTDFKSG